MTTAKHTIFYGFYGFRFWANRFPVNNLCFVLDSGGNPDLKSVFIEMIIVTRFWSRWLYYLHVRVRDFWPCACPSWTSVL